MIVPKLIVKLYQDWIISSTSIMVVDFFRKLDSCWEVFLLI